MASTANDCNAFLKEYKRVLKSLRVGHRPSVPAFPADPRSLPPGLLEQAYDGQAAQVLLPSVLPGHEPGKWMRGTSKELTICKKKASSKKHDDFYAMMQSMHGMQANTKNWQRMQQLMSMMNNDDQEEPLSKLMVFPNKKRTKALEGAATPASSPKASPGGSTSESPAANAGQGTALALQDQEVRKEVQTPDVLAAPFQVPSAKTLLSAAASISGRC